MVLAQEPAVRMCSGESSHSRALWSSNGSREAQETADIGRAVKHAFEVVEGEILDRSRAEAGRDGATALVLLRIGQAAPPLVLGTASSHGHVIRETLVVSSSIYNIMSNHSPFNPALCVSANEVCKDLLIEP